MPLSASIKLDTRGLTRLFDDVQRKQIPFAASMALNATAFEIQREEQAQVRSDFKNPRPFSQKAFGVIKSTKASQTATIFLKPDHQYLAPYILGGPHLLPGKALINPKDIRLDQYGQFRKGQISGLTGNRNVFVGEVDGVMGWWLRVPGKQTKRGKTEGKLRLLARFGDNLPVKATFPFYEVAAHTGKATFPYFFNQAFVKAMRTAKR